jgi:hypothetical protein
MKLLCREDHNGGASRSDVGDRRSNSDWAVKNGAAETLSVAVESKALNAVRIRDVALHLTQYRCFTPYEPPIR